MYISYISIGLSTHGYLAISILASQGQLPNKACGAVRPMSRAFVLEVSGRDFMLLEQARGVTNCNIIES